MATYLLSEDVSGNRVIVVQVNGQRLLLEHRLSTRDPERLVHRLTQRSGLKAGVQTAVTESDHPLAGNLCKKTYRLSNTTAKFCSASPMDVKSVGTSGKWSSVLLADPLL